MKQTYHTDLAIQCHLEILDGETRKNIPKSTLYSWKNRDFSRLVGGDTVFSDGKMELVKAFLSNRTLLNAAKGLYFVYSVCISLMSSMRGMKTMLRKNSEIIVGTIDRIEPLIGLKHACKLFKISENQFYAWKRQIRCIFSPSERCTKQNLLNISPSELQTVKAFVQDEQYKNYPLSAVYYEMMRRGKAFMSLTAFYKYAGRFN
ncbi:MAG: hypothetical protein LBE91_17990, partial [Tannerella sp.]|nr:hypothetical protein [Tannerella sp.]